MAPKGGYEITWSSFNNGTGESTPIGSPATSQEERAPAPSSVSGDFVKASIRAIDPPHAPWSKPVEVFFRRSGWQLETRWSRAVEDRDAGLRDAEGEMRNAGFVAILLSIALAPVAREQPASYQDLLALFKEWRTFQ